VAGEVACQTTFAADPRQPRTTSVVRTQHFQAPHTLQVTHLFGLETSQPEQIRATGEVGIMSLAKADFLTALQLNRILLVNTLNIISSHAQRAGNMLRHVSQLDETGRLAYWLLHYTTRSAYDIRVVSTPETWSRLLLTDVRGYWKAVTLLEKTKAIESQGDDLILLDRYILRKFVDEKLVP
jgi:CRP-like cAMP-binding protein